MSKKLKPEPKLSVAKRKPPRWQHERNLTLIIWVAIPLIIALALGLVGYWGYDTYVAAWNQPVVKIGNDTIVNSAGNMVKGNVTVIDMRYFVKMLKFYSLSTSENTDATTFPYDVLQRIENNEMMIRAAPSMGVQASQNEITEEINNDLISNAAGGGNSTGNITGNITQPLTDLGKMYQQWLNYVHLSDSEYRHLAEATLLTQKLNELFKQNVPTEAKQVHVYAIMVDNEGNATLVEDKLKNGGNFSALAAEYSTDNTTKANGGDLGWLPQGILISELDQAAFSLTIGNVSEPILASNGYYYIIKVTEIEENRPVEDQYREQLAYTAFSNWFTAQMDSTKIVTYLNQSKATWAMNHIT